jgi:hypothetical protein
MPFVDRIVPQAPDYLAPDSTGLDIRQRRTPKGNIASSPSPASVIAPGSGTIAKAAMEPLKVVVIVIGVPSVVCTIVAWTGTDILNRVLPAQSKVVVNWPVPPVVAVYVD